MQAAASPLDRFQTLTQQAWESGQLVKLVLANPHGPDQTLLRVMARPVELKGQPHWSVLYRHQTKDITKNYLPAEGLAVLMALVGVEGFRNAHLHTPTQEIQLAFSKKGKPSLRTGKVESTGAAEAPAQQGHNREKHRFLSLDRPFLRELGVTDAGGHLIPAMSRKWKQINKFIEVFDAAVQRSPLAQADTIHVADFGSGKGYLTFAMHDYIQHSLHKQAKVTGVELRSDLVALCGQVIQKLGLQGMAYEQGDVRDYQPTDLDVMIALHACDIATDYAIHLGIRSGAQIILCSPCCHKQIRPQLLSPHPLRPILQHGIHLGQEAEMLTDGLRALLLEAAGYDTQVFEFISLEHTNKNKMILGVKRARAQDNAEVVKQIAEIKAFYGIREQALEGLLRQDGLLAA
ncbi:MAG: methyltransferase [Aquabacterium sp.]